ncbi:hypothetical protein glysoja_048503 [Glycine soja]|uniref:Separase-like TPR repeats region domain-containing protein n=1 Tax=Glycine soja TaxID=3848 RepID=A0A0B2P1I7_GLYSO|nr:hypothetical protein glysoja_048503 [Glycine soja]
MPPYPSSQNGSLRSPSLTTLSPSSSYSVFTSSASIDWMSSLLNWLPSPSPLSSTTGLAKEDAHLRKVLQLVEEVNPWLRRLDSNSYEKLHKMLVTHLGKCTLNLLGSTPFPDRDLVTLFCCTTLTEYVKSPIKDQVYKVEEENTGTDFVELVYYYANKCQTANASFCNTFAAYLNKIEEHFKQVMTPINSILRLYVVGLLLVSCNLRSRTGDLASSGSAKFECLLGTLLENEKIL